MLRNRAKTTFEKVRDELKGKSKVSYTTSLNEAKLPKHEQLVLGQIRQRVAEHNVNNITRTKAYLDFYKLHPEIHWAFLAHMVSRNGGWNMTDLKGEFLTRLLSEKEQASFFAFLERGNWLIFQDAYPQLMLYEDSLKRGKPLFHLLPYLMISSFMETVWKHFWNGKDSYILTMGLVINEQNYLERRVIQNPTYQKGVFDTLEFMLQDLLSFSQILFPYESRNLAGQTLHQFGSVTERILLGKRLYTILFKDQAFLQQVFNWALEHPHTGSRKDYWPHIFNTVNEGIPGFPYVLRLTSCQLRSGARKIYSPSLENAWKNVNHAVVEKGDWFTDWRISEYLKEDDEIYDGEIMNEYCKSLERLELAAVAKKAISILE